MTPLLWAALTLLGGATYAVTAKLVNDEIRGWLDLLPNIVLRLAARCLRPGQREAIYQDEWLPELAYILQEAETRPITRLVRGLCFSLGLLISATRVARHLNRTPSRHAASTSDATSSEPTSPFIYGTIGGILTDEEKAMVNLMEPKDRARYLLQKRIQEKAEMPVLISQLKSLRHQTAMSVISNIR